jgi:hypothetical protein
VFISENEELKKAVFFLCGSVRILPEAYSQRQNAFYSGYINTAELPVG